MSIVQCGLVVERERQESCIVHSSMPTTTSIEVAALARSPPHRAALEPPLLFRWPATALAAPAAPVSPLVTPASDRSAVRSTGVLRGKHGAWSLHPPLRRPGPPSPNAREPADLGRWDTL